jgi:GH24 family phage-related lysozyme (muramidase)
VNFKLLTNSIKHHEGLRLKAYKLRTSSYRENFYTIGYGHKLSEYRTPISLEEAERLLIEDIKIAKKGVKRLFKRFEYYPSEIQNFLIEMYFNMGNNLALFKKANRALKEGNIPKAIEEYKNSLWAKQVGLNRVNDMMNLLYAGSLKWKR